MLTLITFGGGLREPILSPYCLKAMCLLNLAGADWAPRYVTMPQGPHGKLPVLETPEGLVPDSNLILGWLERRGAPLFPGFDPGARAMAHAVIRMVEESLGKGMVHDRWLDDDCWEHTRAAIFGGMSVPVRAVLPEFLRRRMRRRLADHGIGRMSAEERMVSLCSDLDAVEGVLGGSEWLFGDVPSGADCAVVPVLSMIDTLPADTALRRELRSRRVLMEYVGRGRAQLYPDLSASMPAAA